MGSGHDRGWDGGAGREEGVGKWLKKSNYHFRVFFMLEKEVKEVVEVDTRFPAAVAAAPSLEI